MTVEHSAGYFLMLDETEHREAIRMLASSGMTDRDIADICGLHVEQVRRIIGKRGCEGVQP